MNQRRPLPPLDRLRYLFDVDVDKGLLIRAVSRAHNARKGDVVGSVDGKGYLHVSISGAFFRVHRIIFFMHYGYEPEFGVDHKDCDRRNNRPANLRPATDQQNAGNIKPPKHNTSGYKGVYKHSRGLKWCAQIKQNGETVYLGWFDTPELAAAAYDAAAGKHFGDYARGSRA